MVGSDEGRECGKDVVRVAGIDCGTNSIRLMVADVSDSGMDVVVPRIMHVIRLGQDVDRTHRFAPDALERAYGAAEEFATVLDEHGVDRANVHFVATSATRDAQNREEFEDAIEAILGVRPDVIPGTQEASLSFLGATSAVADDSGSPFMVVDLGGGSTELVVGGAGKDARRVRAAFSMNIGSVRMTERHLVSDPTNDDEIAQAIEDIDAHIDEAFATVPAASVGTLIGVSGTVTTMSAIAQGLRAYDRRAIDGAVIGIDQARAACDDVLRMTRAERREYPVIHPGRVDVIGGGALVWSRVLERVRAAVTADGRTLDSYVASEHGLLDGIVLDLGRRRLSRMV